MLLFCKQLPKIAALAFVCQILQSTLKVNPSAPCFSAHAGASLSALAFVQVTFPRVLTVSNQHKGAKHKAVCILGDCGH